MIPFIASLHKRFVRRKQLFSFIALLLALPLLSACEDTGLLELAAEMAVEWAGEKNLIRTDEAGNIQPDYAQIAIYQGQRWLSGTSGDSQVDAALDAGQIGHSIYQADALAQQGIEEGDPAKLDEAIALRPHDWSYHDQKAALLAAQGDHDGAVEALERSEALVDERIRAGGNCRGLQQNKLRNRESALLQQLETDPDNQALLEMLADTQDSLFYLQNDHPASPCS